MSAQPVIATEATQEAILALLQVSGTLNLFIEEMARMFPPRALQYSRDVSDRMRVAVDTGQLNVGALLWGSAGGEPNWYATGSPNSMDAREVERTQTQIRFQSTRARWTLT